MRAFLARFVEALVLFDHHTDGILFRHALGGFELNHPHIDLVISSTWGEKYDLASLRKFLPAELSERVTDAVYHRLPPMGRMDQRAEVCTSRWNQIQRHREQVRPDIGDCWLAIDDDDRCWPSRELHPPSPLRSPAWRPSFAEGGRECVAPVSTGKSRNRRSSGDACPRRAAQCHWLRRRWRLGPARRGWPAPPVPLAGMTSCAC